MHPLVKLFNRKNKEVRANILSLTPSESSTRGNYVAAPIKKRYFNYYNIDHRKAVCQIDSIAKKLTYIWRDRATAKTFKFYSSHEVDAVEVMQDVRKAWIDMNCMEVLKKCIVPFTRDGYVLLKLDIGEESLDYEVYGEYECPPKQWTRVNNKIVQYRLQYTPRPRGMGTSASLLGINVDTTGSDELQLVKKTYSAKDIIHIERGEPNMGYGDPLIEGAWDSIMKLMLDSHYDMLTKRLVPQLEVTEDEYSSDEAKTKGMLKMVANSDEDTARVWYKKKDATGAVTEYPRFGYVSGTSTLDSGSNNAGKHEGVSTGDYGNISKEWIRLCTITGHTIHYFAGNRAGAVTGSETDTDDDIDQEILDFGLLEPIIKKILEKLADAGKITLPTESYVIKYYKDWENIEAKAKAKEDMLMQQNPSQPNGQQQLGDKNTQQALPDRRNQAVLFDLLHAIKKNMSYPMTAVGSSWISRIGYDDTSEKIFMELLSGAVYSKPAPLGEWSYLDWADSGSKGGYFWDYLSQRDPPWQLDTIPPNLLAYEGFGTPEEMSKFKTTLVGTSREPFTFEMLQERFPGYDWKAIFTEQRSIFDKLKEEYEQLPEPKYKDFQKLIDDYLGTKKNNKYYRDNPFAGYKDWDDCISKNRDKSDPEAYCGKIKHETEDKKNLAYDIIKIPILDYPLINALDTETKIKRLGQANDWSMGTNTATKIKRMLSSLKENANRHQLRISTLNAEAFGNSIKETHPLLYDIGNGMIVEEYICPDSWKKNVGKIVPLGVYHNLEENSPELPSWQIVGNAEVFGWDDEEGYDFVKYNYDYALIDKVFEKLGEYNWLTPSLKENGTNDISTAYYCDIDIKWNDKLQKFIRVQTNIELKSISFVPRGNCPGEVCSLTVVKQNINELQTYIKNCIQEGIDKDHCLEKAYAKFKTK